MCDITEILAEYPKKHGITHAEIADLTGVARSTVERRFNNNDDGAHFPLKDLIPVIRACNNDYTILDHIEKRCGRIAIKISGDPVAVTVSNIAKLTKEAGEAIAVLGESIEDGIIDERECKLCVKELADLIRIANGLMITVMGLHK